jgi:hypothetical protein
MVRVLRAAILIGSILCGTSAFAANWYVSKTATGSNDGTSWTNAWNEWNRINFSSVACGDTVWVAGVNQGTPYSSNLVLSKDCTAASPLLIRRVLSTDSVPVAAAGWKSTFDSQVVTTNADIQEAGPSYITIDGRVGDAASGIPYGMVWNETSDGLDAVVRTGSASTNNMTFSYIEFHGPACVTGSRLGSGSCSNISWGYWVENQSNVANYTVFDHTWWHRFAEILRPVQDYHTTIQYSYIGEENDTGGDHGDLFYAGPPVENLTVKFSVLYDGHNQGPWFDYNGPGYKNMLFANNILIGLGAWTFGIPRCTTACGPVYVYGNAFVQDDAFRASMGTAGYIGGNSGSTITGDWANNIFYSTQLQVNGTAVPPSSALHYDAMSAGFAATCSGAGGGCFNMSLPSPLCSSSWWNNLCPNGDNIATLYQTNMHLTAAGQTEFQGKGENLTSTACVTLDPDICKDMDGNKRPTSGAWTVGPYESNATTTGPQPPTSLAVTVQ